MNNLTATAARDAPDAIWHSFLVDTYCTLPSHWPVAPGASCLVTTRLCCFGVALPRGSAGLLYHVAHATIGRSTIYLEIIVKALSCNFILFLLSFLSRPLSLSCCCCWCCPRLHLVHSALRRESFFPLCRSRSSNCERNSCFLCGCNSTEFFFRFGKVLLSLSI